MPQPHSRQQSALNDMQLLQQQLMYKQLQEFQRQNQLRQFDLVSRQHTPTSQLPSLVKQLSSDLPSQLSNGTPVPDTFSYRSPNEMMGSEPKIGSNSQMSTPGNKSWPIQGASNMQGFSNALMFSPERAPSTGFISQQFDHQPLYGSLLPFTVPSLNQYSYSPGASQDSDGMLTKSGMSKFEKPIPLNSLHTDNQNARFQNYIREDASISKASFQEKPMFRHTPMQSYSSGIATRDSHQVVSQPRNVPEQKLLSDWKGNTQENPSLLGQPSQSSVSLDATEQKILFGSDDNIWSAFGESFMTTTVGSLPGNQIEGSEHLNTFPCVQSGSWSALMQSALAEASSNDTAVPDEWNNSTFQKSDFSSENHSVTSNDNFQAPSSLTSRSFPLSSNANTGTGSHHFHGFQGSINEFPSNQNKEMRNNYFNEYIQPGQSVEQVQAPIHHKNAPAGAWSGQMNDISVQMTHSDQQIGSSHNVTYVQSNNNLNSWNGNVASGGDGGMFPNSDSENALHDSQKVMRVAEDNFGKVRKFEVNKTNTKFSDSWLNSFSNTSHLNPTRTVENNETVFNNNLVELWKNKSVESSIQQKGQYMTQFNTQSVNDEQSKQAYSDKQVHISNGTNCTQHAESNLDRIRENIVQENTISSCNDYGSGNFQYHLMRNSESLENKNQTAGLQGIRSSEAMIHGEPGHFGHPSFVKHIYLSNVISGEKGPLFGSRINGRGSEEASSKDFYSGHATASSASVINSRALSSANQMDSHQTSQNVLELLQKVDRSGANNIRKPFNSLTPAFTSEVSGSVDSDNLSNVPQNQSPGSHGYGLHLAPPSQWASTSSHALAFPPLQSINGTRKSSQQVEEMGQAWMDQREYLPKIHSVCGQSNSDFPHSSIQGDSTTLISSLPQGNQPQNWGNASSSFMRQSKQEQSVVATPSSMVGVSQPDAFSTILHDVWTKISTRKNELASGTNVNAPPQVTSSCLVQSLSNSSGANSPVPQKLDDQKADKGDSLETGTCAINSQEFAYGPEQKDDLQRDESQKRVNVASQSTVTFEGQNTLENCLSETGHNHGPERNSGYKADHSLQNSHNILYGHTIKASEIPHQNYLLLHKSQDIRNADITENKKNGKRLKGSEGEHDVHTVDNNEQFVSRSSGMIRDNREKEININSSPSSFPPGEVNHAQCVYSTGIAGDEVISRNLSEFERGIQNSSNLLGITSMPSPLGGSENNQINPQMAPSWFEQYGTYKNGRSLAQYDEIGNQCQKIASSSYDFYNKSIHEGSNAHLSFQHTNVGSNQLSSSFKVPTTSNTVTDHSPSVQSFSNHAIQNFPLTRPKRRKISSEPIPWHKEITQGSQILHCISLAELDWTEATNRILEKVDDDTALVEDGSPVPYPCKRIILTTQLMQQLFRCIPTKVLSSDATTHYESVSYFAAKLALGDACNLSSNSTSHSDHCTENENSTSNKVDDSEKGKQYFLNVVEGFVNRSKKLEHDLLRLEKMPSIMDVRTECQELEKVSIINRFAKFHSRAPADGPSGSSLTHIRNPFLQRYVVVVPMPRNPPEDVLCLSL